MNLAKLANEFGIFTGSVRAGPSLGFWDLGNWSRAKNEKLVLWRELREIGKSGKLAGKERVPNVKAAGRVRRASAGHPHTGVPTVAHMLVGL